MKGARHLKKSFVAVFALVFVVVFSACSKKDVQQDEPGFNPSEGGTASSDVGSGEASMSAGDSSAAATELETLTFAYDSYGLDSQGRSVLKKNAQYLKDNATATVQVEGHCDDRGTTEYNLALGERRANAAKSYLVKLGIDGSRISVISYGEERPVDSGQDEAAWAKNRRASFVILSK